MLLLLLQLLLLLCLHIMLVRGVRRGLLTCDSVNVLMLCCALCAPPATRGRVIEGEAGNDGGADVGGLPLGLICPVAAAAAGCGA